MPPLFQNESSFDLHENEPVGGIHFHMNGFAQRLVFKQRQKTSQKWPIEILSRKTRSHDSILIYRGLFERK